MSSTEPDTPSPKQKLIDNERAKLSATALNNGAVAATVASVVGPTASELHGITAPTSPYWWAFGACWMILAVGLHLLARRIRGDLEP